MYLESIHGTGCCIASKYLTQQRHELDILGWILQGHTCVLGGLHIHAYGLLHNGVHMRDYLPGRWQCLGIQMELFISFYYPHACAKV